MVICLKQGAGDLCMVQLMLLPPITSCFNKIQNGFYHSDATVYPGCPEKRPLNGCFIVNEAQNCICDFCNSREI